MVKYYTVKGCRNKHKHELYPFCNSCKKKYDNGEKLRVELLVDKNGRRVCAYE